MCLLCFTLLVSCKFGKYFQKETKITINSYLFQPKMLPKWQVTHCRHSLQLVMEKMQFSSTWVLFAYSLPDPAGFSSTERKLNKVPLTHSPSVATTGSRPITKCWEVKGLRKQTSTRHPSLVLLSYRILSRSRPITGAPSYVKNWENKPPGSKAPNLSILILHFTVSWPCNPLTLDWCEIINIQFKLLINKWIHQNLMNAVLSVDDCVLYAWI